MNLEFDPARFLYVVGVAFGVAAVLYFARDVVFELSITVRAALLLCGFVVLFVGALAARRTASVLIFAVLSAAAYLAFLTYTLSRFDVGADGTFFALLVSAGLFLALGHLVRERDLSLSRRTAGSVAVGVGLVAVALVGADVAVSDVEYDVQIADEAVVEGGDAVVGDLTVENRFVFREPIDSPEIYACVYVPGTDEDRHETVPHRVQYHVADDRLPDSVAGGSTIDAEMRVWLREEQAVAVDEPLPIVQDDDCPATSDEPRIVVVTGDAPRPPRR